MLTFIANAILQVLVPVYSAVPLRNPAMGRGQQLVFVTGGVVLAIAIVGFSAPDSITAAANAVSSASVVLGGILILALVKRYLQPAYRDGVKIYVWDHQIPSLEIC